MLSPWNCREWDQFMENDAKILRDSSSLEVLSSNILIVYAYSLCQVDKKLTMATDEGIWNITFRKTRRQRAEGVYGPFSLCVESKTLPHGMVTLTFRMGTASSVRRPCKHSHRQAQSRASCTILTLIKLTGKINHYSIVLAFSLQHPPWVPTK